tara:strand:+ start:14530 stop:15288 length:759 start_codon:yes stop_codon:yes gene_type:complete
MNSTETVLGPVDLFYIEQAKPKIVELNKRGRPRKTKMYFTQVTEDAIIAYNQEPSIRKRNKIWNEHINKPIFKLAENIINRFKFMYMDGGIVEVKSEVVSFLLTKLPKYTADKGKAFSYFSIVAKNYLIQNNNKNYKRLINKAAVDHIDWQRNTGNELALQGTHDGILDFMEQFIEWYEDKIDSKFRLDRDKAIAYAIMQLFKTRENIETYNKKALYILIREMTGAKTQYITKVVKQVKKEYETLFLKYQAR